MINLTNSILQFWFSDKAKEKWFVKDRKFDSEIREKFLEDYEFIKKQSIEDLAKNKKVGHILSRIIALDQFPRNIFRGSKESFSTDQKAVSLSKFIINNDMDMDLIDDELRFIYMPLMHSERLEDQRLCVQNFEDMGDRFSLEYAIKHKDIIEKFGRFPHRNEILGRKSSREELEFLTEPGSSF